MDIEELSGILSVFEHRSIDPNKKRRGFDEILDFLLHILTVRRRDEADLVAETMICDRNYCEVILR